MGSKDLTRTLLTADRLALGGVRLGGGGMEALAGLLGSMAGLRELGLRRRGRGSLRCSCLPSYNTCT